eukprot:2158695-Rhodomonas_salina.1
MLCKSVQRAAVVAFLGLALLAGTAAQQSHSISSARGLKQTLQQAVCYGHDACQGGEFCHLTSCRSEQEFEYVCGQ